MRTTRAESIWRCAQMVSQFVATFRLQCTSTSRTEELVCILTRSRRKAHSQPITSVLLRVCRSTVMETSTSLSCSSTISLLLRITVQRMRLLKAILAQQLTTTATITTTTITTTTDNQIRPTVLRRASNRSWPLCASASTLIWKVS